MMTEPRLITPQGQMIVLTQRQYQNVISSLAINATSIMARPSRDEVRILLADIIGKYAHKVSLTQALLEERRKDREREETKIRYHARRS
ncbi:MAG: hypothetical protein HZB17_04545 [Chloroflexi bacterium]|nr:hypothetical protein [Chloroflexota bacterium]MBI5080559.1 hypothetical protein [Chloroflexota bacterium]